MRRDQLIRRLFDAGSPSRPRTAMQFSPQPMWLARVDTGAVEKTQLNPMMSLQPIDSRVERDGRCIDRAAV
jgi:hypothetical protein